VAPILVREFTDYTSVDTALAVLRKNARVSARREAVPLGRSIDRILCEDVVSRIDVPPRDSSHMDGFAVRSSDIAQASAAAPVRLRWVEGVPLGAVPRKPVRKGEAQAVLTGGFVPLGADAVVQAERVKLSHGRVEVSNPIDQGEHVYPRGRDVNRGEKVLEAGRSVRGTDQTLLASLHIDKVAVFARPRVAIIPTGTELSERIVGTEKGKVAESHSFLFSRLIEGAGGVPVVMPIAPDDSAELSRSIRAGLRVADMVLTIAGSSVSEKDLTENAINLAGKPGVLVHGLKVHRGRVMGFGAVEGKIVVILPGSIQGGVNAFILMAYPVIRSSLGRGFETPSSIPAILGNDWDAIERYRGFTKIVYVKTNTEGASVIADTSVAETERMTLLTRSDGYLVVAEDVPSLRKGEPVRVHRLPGLSPVS